MLDGAVRVGTGTKLCAGARLMGVCSCCCGYGCVHNGLDRRAGHGKGSG